MESPSYPIQLTSMRRELVEWLNDRAPSFTEGYIGAVSLLDMPTFPARVHFICHAVRDIYRRLPTALGGQILASSSRSVSKYGEEISRLLANGSSA